MTKIDGKLFEDILVGTDLKTEVKKGWLKVYPHDPQGDRIYLPVTKGGTVGRVDVAIEGLEEGEGLRPFPGNNGSVTLQLDFEGDMSRVLDNFRNLVQYLTSLPPREVSKKKAKSESKEKTIGFTRLLK
jgi:hypothetical protein